MKTHSFMQSPRLNALTLSVLAVLMLTISVASIPSVASQTQYVVATPGYINLGMTTAIQVTAPAAGTYTATVQEPNGTTLSLNFAFTVAGQSQKATFGIASSGFKSLVEQVGTYNVFVYQGAQLVSSTSFYATNKLVITMDMVSGGTCIYIQDIARGEKFIPRFYVAYASNGALLSNNTKDVSVSFTAPDGTVAKVGWDSFAHLFASSVLPSWNYTSVGAWNPVVTASDGPGNTGTLKYAGIPFVIAPAELSTSVTILDAATGKTVAGLYNGEGVVIQATIGYPSNPEPVKGFVAPLDSTRGGSVTAQVGWGFYNVTSGAFGGKNPGGLLGTVLMTYTGSNGTWSGQFKSSSLPTLPANAAYEVVVSSKDDASPTNSGFAIAALQPVTVTTASATTTVTSVSTIASVTTSIATQNVVQTEQTIPTVVYAALAILLIIGVLVGYIVRVPGMAK